MIKFDKKYSGLFKKNQNSEKVFGYNLYLEENLNKDSSKNKIKQIKQTLFKKYRNDIFEKIYLKILTLLNWKSINILIRMVW